MADHLITVLSSDHSTLKIPFEGEPYDCSPWDSFPDRQGWDTALLGTGESAAKTIPARYVTELECWLFFGVLHEIFTADFKHEDFIRRDGEDQRPYITTRCLHQYVDSALRRGKTRFFSTVDQVVRKAFAQLSKKKVCECMRPEMLFIILVLNATFVLAYGQASKKKMNIHAVPHVRSALAWADSQLLSKGWCPSEVYRFLERYTMHHWLNLAYALQIERPQVKNQQQKHTNCSIGECAENYINNATYETKHVEPGCNCAHLSPNIDQVKNILKKGGIPLIRISSSKTSSRLNLEVVRLSPGRRYIAISHVWSDGLGNEGGNSLPQCQLRMLKSKAKEAMMVSPAYLSKTDVDFPIIATLEVSYHWAGHVGQLIDDSITIWMDTLCVPREREIRNIVIRGMKRAYEKGRFNSPYS